MAAVPPLHRALLPHGAPRRPARPHGRGPRLRRGRLCAPVQAMRRIHGHRRGHLRRDESRLRGRKSAGSRSAAVTSGRTPPRSRRKSPWTSSPRSICSTMPAPGKSWTISSVPATARCAPAGGSSASTTTPGVRPRPGESLVKYGLERTCPHPAPARRRGPVADHQPRRPDVPVRQLLSGTGRLPRRRAREAGFEDFPLGGRHARAVGARRFILGTTSWPRSLWPA